MANNLSEHNPLLGIPFLRVVFKSPLQSHKEAFKQLFLICIASFLPIILSALIDTFQADPTGNTNISFSAFLRNFNGNLQYGELFIYVVTFCAPMAWIFMKFNSASKPVEDLFTGSIIAGLVYSFALVLFVMGRVHNQKPVIQNFQIGYILLIIIIVLTYISMLYECQLSVIDFEKASNKSSISLAERLAKLRR